MTPDRFRLVVSWVLTIGVTLSAGLIALGFAGSFIVGWRGSLLGDPHLDTPITDFGGLLAGLSALRPQAIGQLGLIVLVATPVMRGELAGRIRARPGCDLRLHHRGRAGHPADRCRSHPVGDIKDAIPTDAGAVVAGCEAAHG